MGATTHSDAGSPAHTVDAGATHASPAGADTGARVVELLIWPRNLLAIAGVFLGFWFLSSDGAAEAVKWVCLLSVGGVGVVAYMSHVVFARADAQRLGFGDKPSGFQYEVGFFNLAVAVMAILAVVLSWGAAAQAALCLVYGTYFLQCAGLFVHRVRKEEGGGRFVKNVVIFLILSGFLLFFGIAALV
jgi:hypothetical protein